MGFLTRLYVPMPIVFCRPVVHARVMNNSRQLDILLAAKGPTSTKTRSLATRFVFLIYVDSKHIINLNIFHSVPRTHGDWMRNYT
jgi:hypothetical protein